MTYSDLKYYLKTNLGRPSLDFVWTKSDNEQFYNFINEKFGESYLKSKNNLVEVRQVFREHFENVGYIVFKINSKQLSVEVFPYTIKPKDSLNLDAVVEIITSNINLVQRDYNGMKNQISINGSLKDIIYNYVNKIENEKIHKKELIKCAVRKALELKENDIVLIRKDQIFIKIFEELKRHEVSSDEENTIKNRFNGIDENELRSFYRNYFLSKDNKNFFYYVAQEFVDIYFMDKQIDNATYEKYVFSFIQSIIISQLEETFDHNQEFLKGLSGYVFRLHFEEVFDYIAEMILKEIVRANNYMVEFVKYYTLSIIVLNGEKYKVPSLETEDGLKWNVVSILSVVKVFVKSDITMYELEQEVYKLEDEISVLLIDDLSPVEYHRSLMKEKEKLEEQIALETIKLEKLHETSDSGNSEYKRDMARDRIRRQKRIIDGLKKHLNKISSQMVPKETMKKYNDLEQKIENKVRQYKREERILSQNKEAYESVKLTLTKALTSKTQKL